MRHACGMYGAAPHACGALNLCCQPSARLRRWMLLLADTAQFGRARPRVVSPAHKDSLDGQKVSFRNAPQQKWPIGQQHVPRSAASGWTCAEGHTVGRFARSCAAELLLLLKPASRGRPMLSWTQKDRPQTLKVRPRTAIERATSIMPRLHVGRAWRPRALTMRLRSFTAQARGHACWACTAS